MNAINATNAITPKYANAPDPTYTIRPTRQYTDNQKREALRLLAERNGNCRATARVTGIPWTTLRGWSQQMPHVYESFYNDARAHATETLDTFAPPDPGSLLHALNERADLLIAAITPERIAEAKLPQIARTLAAILPRIDALRRTAAAIDQRVDREDIVNDIRYVLCHHISDTDLLRRISLDLARLAALSDDPTTPPDLPNIPEVAPTTETPPDSPNLATAEEDTYRVGLEMGVPTDETESPINATSPSTYLCSERASNINNQERPDSNYRHPLPYSEERTTGKGDGGLGAPQAQNERANKMSEMSERAPVAPTPPAPPRRPITRDDPESYPSRWAGCA